MPSTFFIPIKYRQDTGALRDLWGWWRLDQEAFLNRSSDLGLSGTYDWWLEGNGKVTVQISGICLELGTSNGGMIRSNAVNVYWEQTITTEWMWNDFGGKKRGTLRSDERTSLWGFKLCKGQVDSDGKVEREDNMLTVRGKWIAMIQLNERITWSNDETQFSLMVKRNTWVVFVRSIRMVTN